jgi:hypothetical protein
LGKKFAKLKVGKTFAFLFLPGVEPNAYMNQYALEKAKAFGVNLQIRRGFGENLVNIMRINMLMPVKLNSFTHLEPYWYSMAATF